MSDAEISSSPLKGNSNDALGVGDETALTGVGPSGTRYFVRIARPSAESVVARFSGLGSFSKADVETIDSLLLGVFRKSFSDSRVDSIALSGDGEPAMTLWAGLGELTAEGSEVKCNVSRQRYRDLGGSL